MVSSSGLIWIYFCRARPNSYTARLFGEKEAATGFQDCSGILESLSPQCHVNFVFVLCKSLHFLDHHESGCCIFATLPIFCVCLCLCVFFITAHLPLCFSLSLLLSLSYFPAHPSCQFGRGCFFLYLSSLPLCLSLCVSMSLLSDFLFVCPFGFYPCPIFLLIPVSNLEGGSPEQCRALGWLP